MVCLTKMFNWKINEDPFCLGKYKTNSLLHLTGRVLTHNWDEICWDGRHPLQVFVGKAPTSGHYQAVGVRGGSSSSGDTYLCDAMPAYSATFLRYGDILWWSKPGELLDRSQCRAKRTSC